MQEDFLHFIWRYQKLQTRKLQTQDKQELKILHPGHHNATPGPDFLEGHILLDKKELQGDIQVQVKSSDWYSHEHTYNKRYRNVILHVVWEADCENIKNGQRKNIPTLVLANYVSKKFFTRFLTWISKDKESIIPCHQQLYQSPTIIWKNLLNKMYQKKIEEKYSWIKELLSKYGSNDDQIAYLVLAKTFGFHTNGKCFLQLAEAIPWSVVKKHLSSPTHLEALFLGQAGFLEIKRRKLDPKSKHYLEILQELFTTCQKNYQLPAPLKEEDWELKGVRPSNTPWVRISQFSQIIHTNPKLYHNLIHVSFEELYMNLSIKPTLYWQTHYRLGKKKKSNNPTLSNHTIYHIFINTIAPLLVSYGLFKKDHYYLNKAILLLKKLPAEKNRVTKLFGELGKPAQSAYESQAMVHLFKNLCSLKKCLSCEVGRYFLQKNKKL